MKISISGTNGFIGKNLVEYYKDHSIQKINREDNVYQSLDYFKPDLILHCAAEIYEPNYMFESNVLLTKKYLDWLKTNKNSSMIYFGSSSEYGNIDKPGKETDPINPIDLYQTTKGMGTLLCQGYARFYDLNIKIIRPYSVYGKYEKPHRLFPKLWKAFKLDEKMTLYAGFHDFIFIEDFIRGVDLIRSNNILKPGDIINLGSGSQYSNLEVLDLFTKITGKKAPVDYIPKMTKIFEKPIWVCDTEYAYKAYNFKTEYTLEMGIKKFLQTAKY